MTSLGHQEDVDTISSLIVGDGDRPLGYLTTLIHEEALVKGRPADCFVGFADYFVGLKMDLAGVLYKTEELGSA